MALQVLLFPKSPLQSAREKNAVWDKELASPSLSAEFLVFVLTLYHLLLSFRVPTLLSLVLWVCLALSAVHHTRHPNVPQLMASEV